MDPDTQAVLRMFVGWISVDVPELHDVEVPRLKESLDRFIVALSPEPSTMPQDEQTR